MARQQLAFDQPVVRPPVSWRAVRGVGMTEIGPSSKPKPDVEERSGVYLVARYPIVEAINANSSATAKRDFLWHGEVGVAPSRYVGTLSDMRPTATLELERIRTLLSKGLLRDARSSISEALKKFPRDESLYALAGLAAPRKATRIAVRFPRRDQEFGWLDEHREGYKGKWVALLGNDLIASADTMKQVLDAVAQKNIEGAPLVHKVE